MSNRERERESEREREREREREIERERIFVSTMDDCMFCMSPVWQHLVRKQVIRIH